MSRKDKPRKKVKKDRRVFCLEVTLFFSGLIVFMLGLFLPLTPLFKAIFDILALLLSGYHVMWEGIEETFHASKEAKRFLPNTHILMTIAALGAVLLGETKEAALLIFIFAGAHFLEEYVEGRSQREITKLLELNPTQARRLTREGQVDLVAVEVLKIGDRVQVLNGGQIPTDGRIVEGHTSIDESTISGESIPREKTVGDEVFASTINGPGTIIIEVSKDSSETVFAKILQLVQASQTHFSPTANRIRRFEPVYVTLVLGIFLVLLAFCPSLLGWSWTRTFATSLTFLVSASPCALAVSVIPATLAGISNLARQGVLFKGGRFLSDLADLKVIAFDKTGTLTQGQPRVVKTKFRTSQPSKEALLALILAMESQSNHPLARAIVNDLSAPHLQTPTVEVENHLGRGLVANYEGRSFRIASPSSFQEVPANWLSEKEAEEAKGRTVVFVAVDEEILGFISIQDKPQTSALTAIDYFKKVGVTTVMLTGDAQLTGQAIGRELGIDKVVTNVLPEQKATMVNQLKQSKGLTAMLGDGVNDAPALAAADLGIAMGEGTDVAIETADVVLMKNDLTKLIKAHKVAKRLTMLIRQNTIFALAVIVLLIAFTFFGHLSVVLSVTLHEGSTLLVLLNSLRLLVSKE